jgi:hypothetical protein
MSKYKQYRSGGKHCSSIMDVDNDIPTMNKYLADYGYIQNEFSNMLGKVLTIIDASIVDKVQNKAVKDIIRNEFIDEYVHLSDALCDQEEIDKCTGDFTDEEINKMGEASIEEVAGH